MRRSALQYNAPAHTSQVAMAAATECGFEVLRHPPYSPAPSICPMAEKYVIGISDALKV